MKWKKEKIEEIEEMIGDLNKLKSFAKDKLKLAQDRLDFLNKEMPEYVEIYKKMKEL